MNVQLPMSTSCRNDTASGIQDHHRLIANSAKKEYFTMLNLMSDSAPVVVQVSTVFQRNAIVIEIISYYQIPKHK